MADYLTSFLDQADSGNAERAHDNDVAIIVALVRRRAPGKAGIGSLHDDDLVRRDAGFEYSPLLDKVAGPNYSQSRAVPKSEAHTVPESAVGLCQHVARTDDRLQLLDEPRVVRPCVVARLDNDWDACHRSRSLSSKSSLTLERIRRIGGGHAIGCVYVIRAAFTPRPTAPLP